MATEVWTHCRVKDGKREMGDGRLEKGEGRRGRLQGGATGEQGLTLMEVLVAVAILAIGLTAVLKGSGENQDALITSREMTVAGMLGQNLLERITATGLDAWTESSGTFEEPFERYAWEFETEQTESDGLEKGMLIIRVESSQVPVLRLEELVFRKGT